MIDKIFTKLMLKFNWSEKIRQRIIFESIEKCHSQVVSGNSTKFYKEAKVNNFQHNRNNITIGDNTHIRGFLQVFAYGGMIKIGDNCYIGENSLIWSGEEISIGNNVLISHNVNIIDSNSHEMDHIERANGFLSLISNGHPTEKGSIQTAKIAIGDNAWINFNSIILKGVVIGKGAIVAAGSVVTKDVPDFAVVAGNPATIVKYTT